MSKVWNTKYGARRVRHDPPTVAEALIAAQGLTDDLAQQVEIAAQLLGVPADDVAGEIAKLRKAERPTISVSSPRRGGVERTVIVEKRRVRTFRREP